MNTLRVGATSQNSHLYSKAPNIARLGFEKISKAARLRFKMIEACLKSDFEGLEKTYGFSLILSTISLIPRVVAVFFGFSSLALKTLMFYKQPEAVSIKDLKLINELVTDGARLRGINIGTLLELFVKIENKREMPLLIDTGKREAQNLIIEIFENLDKESLSEKYRFKLPGKNDYLEGNVSDHAKALKQPSGGRILGMLAEKEVK